MYKEMLKVESNKCAIQDFSKGYFVLLAIVK